MNILIGSHGVGKTTLLNALREINPQLYISDGVSRPIKECKKILDLDNYQEQCIINTLTEWNWIQNLNSKIYTCTRSIIDSYIYSNYFGYDDLAQKSLNIWLANKPSMINYFYIPIEFQIKGDEVRSPDLKFQQDIDKGIRDFINFFSLNVVEVRGNLTQRVDIVNNFLNNKCKLYE